MKHRTLPVKRTPVSQGILKRLSAVTRSRKQRVAATANADDIESDDHSSKISRALTIIFLIHIVVIGLIFFHQKFLDNGAPESQAVAKKPAVAPVQREHELPKLSDGDAVYPVSAGDNYYEVAKKFGIEEADLRAANGDREFRAGAVLRIPPKKIVAVSPELAAYQGQHSAPPAVNDTGLVDAIPVGSEPPPRAVVVRPNVPAPGATPVQRSAERAPAASGTKYVVQAGDNIWRISNRFKVDQNALMKANGITDPKKLKLGMTLVIPR